MAVDVEDEVNFCRSEVFRAEAAGGEFTEQELVEGEDLLGKLAGSLSRRSAQQLRVLVAKTQDGGGFQAYQRGCFADQRME